MKMCITYIATVKAGWWKRINLCDWRLVKGSYCISSAVPATWKEKQERNSTLAAIKIKAA